MTHGPGVGSGSEIGRKLLSYLYRELGISSELLVRLEGSLELVEEQLARLVLSQKTQGAACPLFQ